MFFYLNYSKAYGIKYEQLFILFMNQLISAPQSISWGSQPGNWKVHHLDDSLTRLVSRCWLSSERPVRTVDQEPYFLPKGLFGLPPGMVVGFQGQESQEIGSGTAYLLRP